MLLQIGEREQLDLDFWTGDAVGEIVVEFVSGSPATPVDFSGSVIIWTASSSAHPVLFVRTTADGALRMPAPASGSIILDLPIEISALVTRDRIVRHSIIRDIDGRRETLRTGRLIGKDRQK